MKKLILILTLVVPFTLLSNIQPSKVKSVTVYQTRAEVTRMASLELTSGEQELVFSGISTLVDPNNIQVRGTGNLTILGISFRQNFLNENELPADLKKIKDQIETLGLEIKKLNNGINALESERQLLQANQRIGGNQENLSLEDLKSISTYYRTRIGAISNEILDIQSEVQTKNEELGKLRAHYNDRTSQFRRNSGEIVVSVDAKAATKANLEIIYMVSSAGWRAEYDVRSADVDEPLELNYKAIITQNTGENWKDVKLTLSTGNPMAGIIKPELDPQYLDFNYYNQNMLKKGAVGAAYQMQSNDMRQSAPMAEAEYLEEVVIDDIAVASETKTMYTNYAVERPYSLASGEKPLTVTIRSQEVEADYEYQAVPKLRNRVFLVAKAKNWGELVLLPGPINIFFEGGYVGKSYMNPNVTSDNLPISLGYDPGITIERKKLTELSSKKTIGTNQKETLVYEIIVRNNKSKAITVKIQDQIPVSRNGEIKVENVELDEGAMDATTGEVTWTVKVNPAKQIKRQISFDVKYPKGKDISGL
ncbi:MAG: DUF4139 domain-containing protein [Cyclobacteriaceae bacterium]